MKKIDAILLMAGSGLRTNLPYNKALYEVNKIPLYMYSVIKFNQIKEIENIYLCVSDADFLRVSEEVKENYPSTIIVKGAKTRSDSIKNVLKCISGKNDFIIHDCARPLVEISDIKKLIDTTTLIGTLYHKSADTVKIVKSTVETIDRDDLYMVTTPQYFNVKFINDILTNNEPFTDEIQIFENKVECNFIKESSLNLKFTTIEDLDYITYKLSNENLLVGHSYDFHPFSPNRSLILGGVKIDYELGLLGHSDADALYHAVTEAIIGALNLGDIGSLFPDTDEKYKDMDSSYFLKEVMNLVKERNLMVKCIDSIIYIENPKLKKYKALMANNIKKITHAEYVNVKATTMEKCGLVGEEFGIGCEAICLLTNSK